MFDLKLPKFLAETLHKELSKAQHLLKTNDLNQFRIKVRAGYVPNYDEEWAAFSYLYFGANYLKAFSAVKHLPTPDSGTLRLLDVGCGAGASTAGAIASLSTWLSVEGHRLHITAVDRNRRQLRLYRTLINKWVNTLGKVSVEAQLKDALSILNSAKGQWDAILCSYLIEEQPRNRRNAIVQKLQDLAQNGTNVILIGSCQTSGHCLVEFLGPSHSSFPIQLEYFEINLDKVPQLNREVRPMYSAMS